MCTSATWLITALPGTDCSAHSSAPQALPQLPSTYQACNIVNWASCGKSYGCEVRHHARLGALHVLRCTGILLLHGLLDGPRALPMATDKLGSFKNIL
jgi:hypothetical protein